MILISVKSDAMDVKRQFEKEKDAEKYLVFVKNFHNMERENRMGKKPTNLGHANKMSRMEYDEKFKSILPLKVEIINTEANQLCMPTLLQEARVIR